MDNIKNRLINLFRDSKGKVVIWQSPNIPLIGWAVFSLLGRLVSAEGWKIAAELISFGFIYTWSWLEITRGTTTFRRILGAIVLFASIYSKFH